MTTLADNRGFLAAAKHRGARVVKRSRDQKHQHHHQYTPLHPTSIFAISAPRPIINPAQRLHSNLCKSLSFRHRCICSLRGYAVVAAYFLGPRQPFGHPFDRGIGPDSNRDQDAGQSHTALHPHSVITSNVASSSYQFCVSHESAQENRP